MTNTNFFSVLIFITLTELHNLMYISIYKAMYIHKAKNDNKTLACAQYQIEDIGDTGNNLFTCTFDQ